MAKGIIYKITIHKWDKYNANLKKGHKAILISTGFLDDPKIRSLSPTGKLLVLSCFLVAGDLTSSQFEVSHDSLVHQSGVKSGSLQSQLDLLQSLQILTYEKTDVLYNRIEKKVKEKKRIETKGDEIQNHAPVVQLRKPKASAPVDVQPVIAKYCEAWKSRYGANPPITGTVSGQIKNLVKNFGPEKAADLIETYLVMNDHWYLTKRHDIPTLLLNLNAVVQFQETGKMLTRKEVANSDTSQTLRNQLAQFDKERI